MISSSSTLKYVTHHVLRHNVTGIITFDQPLWWKALAITLSTALNLVLSTSTWHISHAHQFLQHIILLSDSSSHHAKQLLHLQYDDLSDDLHNSIRSYLAPQQK